MLQKIKYILKNTLFFLLKSKAPYAEDSTRGTLKDYFLSFLKLLKIAAQVVGNYTLTCFLRERRARKGDRAFPLSPRLIANHRLVKNVLVRYSRTTPRRGEPAPNPLRNVSRLLLYQGRKSLPKSSFRPSYLQ